MKEVHSQKDAIELQRKAEELPILLDDIDKMIEEGLIRRADSVLKMVKRHFGFREEPKSGISSEETYKSK